MSKPIQAIIALVSLFALLGGTSYADIYRFVDGEGNVIFSDYPKGTGYELFIKTEKRFDYGEESPGENKWIIGYAEKICLLKGVDPDLVKAIIKVESGFDHVAVSRKGAKGIMQLLPSSFPGMNEGDLMDPLKNIEVGVGHMKSLLSRFNGNKTMALAAYNAGVGAVLKYGGVPPFPETRNYVERVMGEYERYRESRWER